MSWWRGATVYQVYIRSFADSDGDGVGDLEGLRSRLDHLAWLGIDAIWVTPFFRSPMVDHGYDVSDPRDVDPLFGSLDAFDALIADAHRLGIRVVIDMIPNHTSDRHPWFQEALAAPPGSPARDRYLFVPAAPDGGPPNNWASVFGGPAWSPSGDGEMYLHLFAPEQPDLNWRHPDVHADAERTLRFWLDRGVDGIRIDVAHGLFKDAELRDNPERDGVPDGLSDFARMEQVRTFDQDEVHEVYRSWRSITDGYEHAPVLVGEVFLWDPERVRRYVRPDELHLAFSFLLLGQRWVPADLRRAVELTMGETDGSTIGWALSNHDLTRHATRFGGGEAGQRRARAGALLLLALPGTSFLYYGEELGLEEADVPGHARQDPMWFRTEGAVAGRDGCRVPMPWDGDEPACGFTDGAPWLPVPAGWGAKSVAALRADHRSILHLYRAAIAARRASAAIRGDGFRWRAAPPDVVAFDRTLPGSGGLAVLVNAGSSTAVVDVAGAAEVLVTSGDGVAVRDGRVTLPADTAAWVTLGSG